MSTLDLKTRKAWKRANGIEQATMLRESLNEVATPEIIEIADLLKRQFRNMGRQTALEVLMHLGLLIERETRLAAKE